jgi:hypothetical protein
MRTTLDLDEDVLLAARELARREKRPMGKIVSDLARRALRGPATKHKKGVPLFPQLGEGRGSVSLDLVNRLRDEAP